MLQLSSSHLYKNVKTWPNVFVSFIINVWTVRGFALDLQALKKQTKNIVMQCCFSSMFVGNTSLASRTFIRRATIVPKMEFHGYLADPGKAKGCSTNTVVINLISKEVTLFFPGINSATLPKQLKMGLPVIK